MKDNPSPAVVPGKRIKPKKPWADFPLFPHNTRRWAKKIGGKMHYFGPWEDPEGALDRYLDQRDDLKAGRRPGRPGEAQVRDVLNAFLNAKRHLLDTREITPRTWADYYATCDRIGKAFGKTRAVADLRPDDFTAYRAAIGETWGPVRLANEVQRVRSVFKYAADAELIDRPVKFGPDFKKPSKRVLRKARADRGPRMFEAAELRTMLKAAPMGLKAMILLGVNCGYGNADVAALELRHLDPKRGWADFPRPKTGIHRRCPLWPETVKTLSAWLKVRPTPKDDAHTDRVFITKHGNVWDKGPSSTGTHGGPLSLEFKKLLQRLHLHRPRLGFYGLRHTFETVGGNSRDQVAVDAIMGHAPDDADMGTIYRERVDDKRLLAVTTTIRRWLFGTATPR